MAFNPFLMATTILILSLLGSASASNYGNGPKQDYTKSKSSIPKLDFGSLRKPKLAKPDYGYGPTLPIVIQGLVLCKTGSNYAPLQGAVARITCLAEDKNGYETTPFSCLTNATNAKGYFLKTLPMYDHNDAQLNYTECKAYLESSPSETCQVPSDINHGISGALLSSYRVLNDKKIKLYSVAPFFYTHETNPTSHGHY